jgi:2-polyprenyl-6-methoxyphenol hydroxylase-like FAD-dependent oxidoreductase
MTRNDRPTDTGTTARRAATKRRAARRTVLISGAGIAGTALAYWLHRSGFAVTVVEKAGALRDGGYPVDVRGTAVDVVRRMAMLPRLRDAHVDSRRCTFLHPDGSALASVDPRAVTGGDAGQDVEVRRGDLARALYARVHDDVEFLFGDSVAALDQSAHGVDVVLRRGRQRTFDLVIGADGVHSATRESLFGPEARFHRYLGHCFALFTLPNAFGLSHEVTLWNAPGRAAALYAVGDADELHALLTFHRQEPPLDVLRDPDAQRDLVAAAFAGAAWRVPEVVGAMREADDLFLDTVGQIRMPRWSEGRVGLVGDAAYAPSFLTGQGSSLALVGAYVLAHALATHRDHTAAFAAYERGARGFVAVNQALVDTGAATLFPATADALERRNARLRGLADLPSAPVRPAHSAHSALALSDLAPPEPWSVSSARGW